MQIPSSQLCLHDSVSKKARSIALSDVATYTGSDVESDDDGECTWDITWGWHEDLGEVFTNAFAASCDARADVEHQSGECTQDQDSCHPLVCEELAGKLLEMAWEMANDVVTLAIVCWILLVNGAARVLKESAVAVCFSWNSGLKEESEIIFHDGVGFKPMPPPKTSSFLRVSGGQHSRV